MVFDFKACFGENKTVAAAVSGGSDSMALLSLLLDSREKLGVKVVAINVEHGIRGEKSARDSEFVKNFCLNRGVPLASYSVNSLEYAEKHGLSVEQAARELRYDCFFKAIESGFCDVVATAHHAQDNLETVLFNLLRGTGLKGVAGISETGYDGKIIRPLLPFTKAEINDYVKENGVPFVTDETNFSDEYSRNFLRLNVIPKIKELFPDAETSVYRFSNLAAKENEYLEEEAKRAVKLITGGKNVDDKNGRVKEARISSSVPEVIFKRAVIFALKALGVTKDWEKTHIDEAFSLTDKETGKSFNLLSGIVCRKEYGEVVFSVCEKLRRGGENGQADGQSENQACGILLGQAEEAYETDGKSGKGDLYIPLFPLVGGAKSFTAGEKIYRIEEISAKSVNLKDGLYLAAEKIPETAVIRFYRDGDIFKKFGGGTKKLCDIFTDEKIPRAKRGEIPLLASENKVLAIFGRKISDDARADELTKMLFKLS